MFFAVLMVGYVALAFGRGNETYTPTLLAYAMIFPAPILIAAFTRLVQQSIDARFEAFRSFREIGGRRSSIVWWLFAEGVVIIVVSVLVGIALKPISTALVVSPLFSASSAVIGSDYSLVLTVGVSVLFLTVLMGLAVFFARGKLTQPERRRVAPAAWTTWVMVVIGAVGLGLALFFTLGPSLGWYQAPPTYVGFFALPWAVAAPLLLLIGVSTVGAIALRVGGWNAVSLASRSVMARFPTGVVLALTLLIGYPSCVFTSEKAMLEGGRIEMASHIRSDQRLVVAGDGLLTPTDAETLCENLGADCVGSLEWGVSKRRDPDAESAAPRMMRVMHPTSRTAFDSVFLDEFARYNSTSQFTWDWLKPWSEVIDARPDTVTGTALVVTSTAVAPPGTRMISSQELPRVLPDALYYPYADSLGDREIPLLFFFFTVSGLAALFAVSVARQWPLIELDDALTTVGTPRRTRVLTRIGVAVAPGIVAILVTAVVMTMISSVTISSFYPAEGFAIRLAPLHPSAVTLILFGLLAVLVPALRTTRS